MRGFLLFVPILFGYIPFTAAVSILYLIAADPAFADYQAAEAAFQASKFAEARKELENLADGENPHVFRLLGEMTRDGQGGPAEPVEAYKLFSLLFMTTQDPQERATAFALRRKVASSLQKDGILDAERRVVTWVDVRLGQAGREKQVEDLQKELRACNKECDGLAIKVFKLGPAASDLVPALEELMTRDPKWMPRETYAYALAAIGTKGAPALARIVLDEKEMVKEGFWNLQQAIRALGSLGPTAGAARPSLLKALRRDYGSLGGAEKGFINDLTGGTMEEFIIQLKFAIADAIIKITDADHEIRGALYDYMNADTNVPIKLATAWAIGLTYHEPEIGLDLAENALKGNDPFSQQAALSLTREFLSFPEMKGRIANLLPRIKESGSETETNSGVRSAARAALDAFAAADLNAATELMLMKEYAAAKVKIEAVIAVNPWSETGLNIRGEAKRELGDIDSAIKDFAAAMEIGGSGYSLQFALQAAGLLQGEVTGDLDEATREALPKCIRDEKCYAAFKRF